MYKLILAGGRDFIDSTAIVDAINSLEEAGMFTTANLEIVSGMAEGADMTGYDLAKENGLAVEEFHAEWNDVHTDAPCVVGTNKYGNKYNKLAGFNRNHEMGQYADGLLAFWDGKSRGTKDMIDFMHKLNKPVTIINY
jgi:hypothetical protein